MSANTSMTLVDAATTAECERIRACFPHPQAALVPVLRAVQAQTGWLSPETQAEVARFLSITPMAVHEVVSFYPMLYDRPVGRHVIHVCRTLSCDACGGRELFEHIAQRLGVPRGGTTVGFASYIRLALTEVDSNGTSMTASAKFERHTTVPSRSEARRASSSGRPT